MNKCICKSALLSLTLLLGGCASSTNSDAIEVCYIQFKAETLVATTPSGIFEYPGDCHMIPSHGELAAKIQEYVSDKSNPVDDQPNFDFMFVRVGILDGDKPTFVDRNGVVLVHTEMYQLPKETTEKLDALLDQAFENSK